MAVGGIGSRTGAGGARYRAMLAERRQRAEQRRAAEQRDARDAWRSSAAAVAGQVHSAGASLAEGMLTLTLQGIADKQAAEKQKQLAAMQRTVAGLSF